MLQSKHEARESLRQSSQGYGKPIISADFKGNRFVGVGSQLFFSKIEKTQSFIDFLGNYIRQVLDPDWGNKEIAKPLEKRHPILQWYDEICRLQSKYKSKESQVIEMPVLGVTRAYYGLAYNLYLLQHNVELQSFLIKRLKQKEAFHSACYETYVAAWFILAGFTLRLENEQDGSITHCEFSATSKSGKSYSIEAKARAPGKAHLDVGNQLYKALNKTAKNERIVFVDLNVPSDTDEDRFISEVSSSIKDREEKLTINGEPAPPAYVVVTNHPYHLHLMEERIRCGILAEGFKIPDYGNSASFPSLIHAYKALVKHEDIDSVIKACQQYQIPITFDGEIPEFSFGKAERRFVVGEVYEFDDGAKGILTSGIVAEQEKKLYLTLQMQNGNYCIYAGAMSDAELRAYQKHPETFFGQVIKTSSKCETPMDWFLFFYNSYKETPRERIIEFFANSSDFECLKELSTEDLRLTFAERSALSVLSIQDQAK